MFNNFSILSELIMEDGALANRFLSKLSKVYRYVVCNLKRDVVSIREELGFLDSYVYLIKIRYDAAVRIEVGEALQSAEGNIPPACLQLLVENAIKHNRISEEKPLSIRLSLEGGYIGVENDIRPVLSELHSTGTGLQNIIDRYSILSDKKPVIEKNGNVYRVRLPVL